MIRFYELWNWLFYKITFKKLSRPKILNHNGESIFCYPERKWNFVPFPAQKGNVFNADNLATVNRHDFIDEAKFIETINITEKRWGKPGNVRDISWRLHTILWATSYALNHFKNYKNYIFLECGTGKGYMAAGVCNYHRLNKESPEYFLLDTFKPFLEKGSFRTKPADFAYSDGEEEVRTYFAMYENVKIIKGLIPSTLGELPNKKIAFLHLDLNNAQAEYQALEYLRNKFSKGSIIIFDDFGGFGGDEQALVHKNYAKSINRELLVLPTGQAVLIV